jgi:hypothetical protein
MFAVLTLKASTPAKLTIKECVPGLDDVGLICSADWTGSFVTVLLVCELTSLH